MFDLVPFERSRGLFDYFDKMSQDFFGDMENASFSFRTDILDKGDKYVLKADMPGFDKQDIHLDIKGNYLTLSAQHNEEVNDNSKDFVRRERRYGSVSRSFDITNIDADKISANYDNGVLELQLPKRETTAPSSRKIEIQ